MFRKKEKVEFTQDVPQFCVRYVGHTLTFSPSGNGCTQKPVQKMWDNGGEERKMKKVVLSVTSGGIFMKDCDNKKNVKAFDIKNIAHCCAEQGAHERIFSWIYREDDESYKCHAVICSHKEKAQAIAVVLSRAFHTAYVDWKHTKDKQARNKNKASSSDVVANRDSRSGSVSSGQSSLANGSPGSGGKTAIDRCIAEMSINDKHSQSNSGATFSTTNPLSQAAVGDV